MTVSFENEFGRELIPEEEALAGEVIRASLEETGCPFEAQVNVLITDSEGIREMNRQFRGIDEPTDVLSFPLQEYPAPADFSGLNEKDPDAFDQESGELLLGDIVVNAERASEQAEAYGHSLKREYAFLIAHSMLHLTGFDHMEDPEREEMEERQRRIMEKLGIGR